MITKTQPQPAARRAKQHERKLFRASQPVVWLFVMFARWRRKDVVKVPFLGYAINGAVAVREMLLDAEHFPNTNSDPSSVLITQVVGEKSLTNQNGEPHLALRRQLQDLFTPRYVNQLCDLVLTDVMQDFHDRLLAGETVDVAEYTRVMTGSVVCHMNGYNFPPEQLRERALQLTEIGRQIAAMVPARLRAVDTERLAQAERLIEQLIEGVHEQYLHGDDTTIPGRMRERGIPWDTARGIMVILILGGTETTQSGALRLVAMLADTNQWSLLRDDHSLLNNAMDEGLRAATPVPAITRWVGEDYTFRGVKMKKDKLVIAFLNNAVRDRRVIKNGNDFDITRTIPRELRQLPFGAGPHFCLGFNLARREISMLIEQLLRLPREIEIVEREYADEVLMPTYKSLRIRMKSKES